MSNDEQSEFQPRELSPVETLRHSMAHLLASAVARLYPGTKFAIGPHIEHGFYYDMDVANGPITEDDLPKIEAEMRTIAKGNHPFLKASKSREEALAWADEQGQTYKRLLIESFTDERIGFYTHGDFTDMCAGPHVRYSSNLKHFRLTKVSGAYWRGNDKNPQLTRVYGVAFESKEELEKHLWAIEEAKKRDHRKLGRELDLFMFHDWAPGAAFWLPHGEFIYNTLAARMRTLLAGSGYDVVRTPLIFDKKLFETSGHWEHYREDMFHFPDSHHGHDHTHDHDHGEDSREFGVKPMNCPSHMLIFKSRKRSYRELPLRIHDQGVLHRNERSGALSGLTRVRQFSQDDAHIFCMEEQIADEVTALLGLIDRVYSAFGMTFELFLSTRPEKKLGDDALWDRAEGALREALERSGKPYGLKEGDGAFYGPKIDFQVLDALERRHQCATIQLDYQLPRRFELSYAGADNQLHTPVVIHRAVMGSFERFIGILIEHFAGAFPVWLAPEQVRIMTVSEKTDAYAQELLARFQASGVRATLDDGADKISYKIRACHGKKVPYMAVVGAKEAEDGTVAIRSRDHGDLGVLSADDFLARVVGESGIPF